MMMMMVVVMMIFNTSTTSRPCQQGGICCMGELHGYIQLKSSPSSVPLFFFGTPRLQKNQNEYPKPPAVFPTVLSKK